MNTERRMFPLEDPAYTPAHPPVNGLVPDVVAKWGPPSQLRWFRRFGRQLSPGQQWEQFYCESELHRGPCCYSCFEEWQAGAGMDPEPGRCCCYAIKEAP